ncbi:MAG: hypothetical protein E6G00_04160 [Actinobacteria bacterium]|nr:MAG: hypothetical protein E6G00_04160 [Actinomycetota bacterium]
MSVPLSVLIFLPLAAGLVGAVAPRGWARWVVLAGTVGVLGLAIWILADFSLGSRGLHNVTNTQWIPELGIRYSLGVDGLNLFLIALTALLWVPATLAAALREWDRPRLFFFQMALAETAVLGAFCAQDLALFVFFFDLMLVPFYFLIGSWGGRQRVRATTKLVIYTLVGSLLMLAGAVALGVLSTPHGGHVSFSLAVLSHRILHKGTQEWIFLLFPSSSRRRPSRSTAGCRTPTGRRRSRCWSCSPPSSRRSGCTASCGSCFRCSRRPRSTTRR